MKRTLIATIASGMLVLAAPGVASAHHGRHHHATAHRRHGRGARLQTFTAAGPTGMTTPTMPAPETAGTVTSFTGGVLTITLNDGTVVSGKVTEETDLDCTTSTPPPTSGHDDQGGGDDENGSANGEHGGPSPMGMEHRNFHGDDGVGDDADQGENETCTTSALVPTAKVLEAELSVSSAGAVWEKVDLLQ